jgi:O-antigen/teichoic acid export membrane protein
MKRLLASIARALGIDGAVAVAFAGRLWQSVAGLGTLFFVIRYFSPDTQGYFQTFLSLVALQSFFELGLLAVIIVVVSHEWAGLTGSRTASLAGDPEKRARLAAAARFVGLWFGCAALLLLVAGGGAGYAILAQHGNPGAWLSPWIATIVLAAVLLWSQGLVAVLEGCNQLYGVALYRFIQAVLSSLALWIAAAMGAGLWALPIQLLVSVLCALIFLGVAYRRFLLDLLATRTASTFRWRVDIWPMQWQLALQGVAGYFMFSLFVPVMFSYRGPVEAGRMGLSLQVILAMIALATTWLAVTTPRLGTMFAGREYRSFETAWARSARASMMILCTGAVAVLVCVWVANQRGVQVAGRFLGPGPFTLLVLWAVILQIMQCLATYWRAQRVELLNIWGIAPGLATGLATWLLGSWWGAFGATLGAVLAGGLVSLPLILFFFLKSRKAVKWLQAEAASAPV